MWCGILLDGLFFVRTSNIIFSHTIGVCERSRKILHLCGFDGLLVLLCTCIFHNLVYIAIVRCDFLGSTLPFGSATVGRNVTDILDFSSFFLYQTPQTRDKFASFPLILCA